MRRHHIPAVIPLLVLVALAAGLLAGCGGGSTATGPATSASAAGPAAGHASAATKTSKASHTTATQPPRTAKTTAAAARPSPHSFASAVITQAASTRLAKSGTLVLPVAVGGPGKVSAFGQAEIPHVGIVHVADAKPVVAKKAGIVDLTLTLAPVARQQLAAGRTIVAFVAVSFSKGPVMQRMRIVLRP